MPLNLGWPLLRREVRRQRGTSLVLQVCLHLMGMRLWRRVWELWSMRLHTMRRHVCLLLALRIRVVDGRLRHIRKAVDCLRCWPVRPNWLAHVWAHSSDVISGRRSRSHKRLRCMCSLHWEAMVAQEGAARYWWRSRRGVLSHMHKWRTLEVLREHRRFRSIALFPCAGICRIFVVAVRSTSLEVARTAMLDWTGMVVVSGDQVADIA